MKLKHDELLSNVACFGFNFNLRLYILDVNKTGALTNLEIWTFLHSIHKTWISNPDNYDLNMLDVRDELFDMVKPEVAGRACPNT